MRAIISRAMLLIAAMLLPPPAWGQGLTKAEIDSGTIVRMRLSGQESVRGRLLQRFAPADTVLMFCRYPATPCASRSDPHAQRLPASQVMQLEVAHGTHWFTGALIGGVIAGPIAALEVSFAEGLCDETRCVTDAKHRAVGLVAFGVALGALLGAQSVGWRAAP